MAKSSPSEQTILVTGASGYVASHILHAFLSAGYNVRGTIRSTSSIDTIKAAHKQYASQLSFAVVPDISAPDAFDDAVKGVSGIIHTASPFVITPEDVERDLLKPAIRGTLNVLEAAAAHGDASLSRVVITSSFAAIVDLSQGYRPGYTYSETDWSPVSYEAAANSPQPDGGFAYCASKLLAEKAAWDWMKEHAPSFTLSVINPPWIFGPTLYPITSMARLNESTETIYKLINGSLKAVPATDFAGFSHVRDVALAHLRAYEVEEAAGQRFLVGNHFDYQTAVDVIRKQFPELQERTPEGVLGAGATEKVYQVNGSKAERVLGLKYTSLEVTLRETVEGLLEAERRLVGK